MPELTAVQELEQIAADQAMENAAAGKKPAAKKPAAAAPKPLDYSKDDIALIEKTAASSATGKLDNEQVKTLLKNPAFTSKSLPSLRGKVSALGIYKKLDPAAPKPKTAGDAPTRKLDFVRTIENMLDVQIDAFATFEKASKLQLENMVKALISLSDHKETK
jgi:hypothetical protein